MPRGKETQRLHICLDKQTMTVLKQKAAYKNVSMNEYLKGLINQVQVKNFEIEIHNLDDIIYQLDNITFKASGYYNAVIIKNLDNPNVGTDVGNDMVKLFASLAECLEVYYTDLVNNRKAHVEEDRKHFDELLTSAARGSYRNKDITIEDSARYDIDFLMTQEEKKSLKTYLASPACPFPNDYSSYFRFLIMAKYYIHLTTKTDDLNRMTDIIYSATKYANRFMAMMIHQGNESAEQAKELKTYYDKVRSCQNEIWNIVENDRRSFYQKHITKVQICDNQANSIYVRERRRKETIIWQLQESNPTTEQELR